MLISCESRFALEPVFTLYFTALVSFVGLIYLPSRG